MNIHFNALFAVNKLQLIIWKNNVKCKMQSLEIFLSKMNYNIFEINS